jgi:glutamyl-tRNA reductase
MERLVIVGASYRHAPVTALGTYALPKAEVEARLPRIAAAIGAPELAYVGTCNRVEFVLAGDDSTSAEAYRDRLTEVLNNHVQGAPDRLFRAWQGDGAAEHLLLVASGLDSARRGEPEIRTQVRAAWQSARRAGTSGPILDRLFADALKTAAEVQGFISRQLGVTSLSDGALAHVKAHLQGRKGVVVLVGASPMTQRCAHILHQDGHSLVVASRTLDSARTLANAVNGTAMTLDDLKRQAGPFDVLIAATGAYETVLSAAEIAPWTKALNGLTVVDFGVPANIDAAVADIDGVRLIDMDLLIDEARTGVNVERPEMAMAREIVDTHLDRLRSETALRRAGPAIRDVVAHYQNLAKSSVENEFGFADTAEQERLRAWADLMARRFMHTTLAGLRALAAHGDPAAVNLFLQGLSQSLPAPPAESPEALPPAEPKP